MEAQEQAGSRYSRDLQVDDKDTESIISRFAGIGFDDDLEIIANDYKKFSESTREVKKKAEIEKFKKQYVDNQIITNEFVEGLYQLKNLRDKSYSNVIHSIPSYVLYSINKLALRVLLSKSLLHLLYGHIRYE